MSMFATTYNEAFNWPKQTTCGIKKWPKDRHVKPKNKEQNYSLLYRNCETLMQLTKECLTPFDSLLRPKPIVQTIPSEPFNSLDLPKDDGSARFTRPRVYKAPEILLDNIKDPEVRKKIIDYTYSTTWGMASKDAATKINKRQIPNSTWEEPYHVLFKKLEDSVEAECEGVLKGELSEWEKAQSRTSADPTSSFWQRFRIQTKVLVDQDVLDIKSPEYTRKILCLAEEGKLRFPYKLKPTNYAGFMPKFPVEIEAKKLELEFSDPMISVYQLANRWADK